MSAAPRRGVPRGARPLAWERWSGAGNTFVVLDRESLPPGWTGGALARALCTGAAGETSDGLLVVAGEEVQFWNRDGSAAAFCGNGARVLVARRLAAGARPPVRLRFSGALVRGWAIGQHYAVEAPPPKDACVPAPEALAAPLEDLAGVLRRVIWVVAGVPHLCLLLAAAPGHSRSAARDRLHAPATRLRRAAWAGPVGTNVDFLWPLAGGLFALESFERGVEDFTPACGSGALAAAALFSTEVRQAGVRFQVASGAELQVIEEGPAWRLQGPAVRLARGRELLAGRPPARS